MKAPAPQAIAEHGFMVAVAERPADLRVDAEHGEKPRRGAARDYLVGLAGAIDGHVVTKIRAGFFEEVEAGAPGQVVVRRIRLFFAWRWSPRCVPGARLLRRAEGEEARHRRC